MIQMLCASCADGRSGTAQTVASWCSACHRWVPPGEPVAVVAGVARVERGTIPDLTPALAARLRRVAEDLGVPAHITRVSGGIGLDLGAGWSVTGVEPPRADPRLDTHASTPRSA